MRRALIVALTVLLIVLLGVGGAALISGLRNSDDDDPGAREEPRPSAEVTLIAGRADALVLDPTLLRPLSLPRTIEAAERGAATARITPVLVNGREESVVWPGGTPLTITSIDGSGSLVLDPTAVEAGAEGVTVHLDGTAARLSPGPYRLDGPVAVGAEGLGRSADSVTFDATERTVVAFEGAAVLTLPAEPTTLEGVGEVRITGDLEVTTAEADRRAQVVEFGPGPYRFDLVWVPGRLEIDGSLEGDVTIA